MVTWELRALGGSPKLPQTQDVPNFDYAEYARMVRLAGYRIDGPADVERVLDQAFSADRPAVIDVRADPDVIALPAHATWEQTTNFFSALAKGDPDRNAVLTQLAAQSGV